MMDKEKQIEEMAKVLCPKVLTEYCASGNCTNPNCLVNAKALKTLYEAGYRKQSEGEWVQSGDFHGEMYKCSNCGQFVHEDLLRHFKFCTNCGAKMKGV